MDEREPQGADAQGASSAVQTELTDKAVKGMAAMGARAIVIRILGLAGNLVIAPLLGPSGYGVVAIGMIFMMVSRFISDGGLNAAFLGRESPPTQRELRAMVGFQMTITGIVGAIAFGIVPFTGENGLAIALMASSLFLAVPRVPTTVVLERDLQYSLIIRADIAEALIYNVLAIGLVIAGLGPLGVGIATALKVLVGSSVLIFGGPIGFVRPSWKWGVLGNQARFGVFFQISWILTLIRDEGLAILIGAIGGTAALGAWALARRLLIILTTVFETAWRVALPGLARLMEAGESTKRIMEQGLAFAALGTGVPVVGLIATVPALVPALFGDDWQGTIDIVPWMAGGMMLGVPVGTVLVSLLWVKQEADRVVYIGIPSVILSLGVGAALLPSMGVTGAGIGYFAGQATFFVACYVGSRDLFTPRAIWGGLAPTIAAFIASAVGYEFSSHMSNNWAGIGAGLGIGLSLYFALMVVLDFPSLRRMGRLAGRGVGVATA
ncbi:MAG: oligosaccharide flippase family protein [Solirubrobacteraceae bacterium]|nr:oligosaccharide flippase family protein [Solirubrobacteraceae bacterium]